VCREQRAFDRWLVFALVLFRKLIFVSINAVVLKPITINKHETFCSNQQTTWIIPY
jgi:hypothetical protein